MYENSDLCVGIGHSQRRTDRFAGSPPIRTLSHPSLHSLAAAAGDVTSDRCPSLPPSVCRCVVRSVGGWVAQKLRDEVKAALRSCDFERRIAVLRTLDFTRLNADTDLLKAVAFQFGQSTALARN